MINYELLKNSYSGITDELCDKFDTYAKLLVEWNEKINLTAITDADEIAIKHFADSLYMQKYVPSGASVIDVGTGAGFPGVPLAIFRNDVEVTLLDALQKRLNFLDTVLDSVGVSAKLVHGRAEDMSHDAEYREQFDIATARAVAPLNVLCEYCLPYVKVGGCFVAMKGSKDETADAMNAIKELGGEIIEQISYKLANDDDRMMIVIKKISQTPTKYPRKQKKITQKPL